jgi:hypothetical protein
MRSWLIKRLAAFDTALAELFNSSAIPEAVSTPSAISWNTISSNETVRHDLVITSVESLFKYKVTSIAKELGEASGDQMLTNSEFNPQSCSLLTPALQLMTLVRARHLSSSLPLQWPEAHGY